MTEDTDQDQKTEEPTGKRLSEAREKGNVPVSKEMASFIMLVGIVITIAWLLPILGRDVKVALRPFLEVPHQISLLDGGFQNALMGVLSQTALSIVLVFSLILVAAVIGTMIQSDFYFGTGKMNFDIKKLLPKNSFKQIFSINSVAELAKSFFKLVVLGYVAYRVLLPVFTGVPRLIEVNIFDAMQFLHDEITHLFIVLLQVIIVIAVADLLFVRYQYFKGLRMTKHEVKDENKQMEGDPMIKGRIRQMRLEKARRRMMANVPNASVVITNPTHYAIALEYDGLKMFAPVVTAKGVDHIAARIREVAEEHEIPMVSNPPLARALYDTAELDEPIQPEHYRAVAEVISYVYKLKSAKH